MDKIYCTECFARTKHQNNKSENIYNCWKYWFNIYPLFFSVFADNTPFLSILIKYWLCFSSLVKGFYLIFQSLHLKIIMFLYSHTLKLNIWLSLHSCSVIKLFHIECKLLLENKLHMRLQKKPKPDSYHEHYWLNYNHVSCLFWWLPGEVSITIMFYHNVNGFSVKFLFWKNVPFL